MKGCLLVLCWMVIFRQIIFQSSIGKFNIPLGNLFKKMVFSSWKQKTLLKNYCPNKFSDVAPTKKIVFFFFFRFQKQFPNTTKNTKKVFVDYFLKNKFGKWPEN
jgi:hypothetical protein